MYKTFTAFVALLAVLPLLSPGKALAGPPEGASGKMVLAQDKVSRALLNYRRESDAHRRLAMLTDLARVRDPRVAIALGKALYDPSADLRVQAAFGIFFNQTGEVPRKMMRGPEALSWARDWWDKNEPDLRRRAARLPQ